MLQIKFKVVRYGVVIIETTRGNYESITDAAKTISDEVIALEMSENGYFAHFNTKMNEDEDDYKFGWNCDWESIEEIANSKYFEVGDVGKSANDNFIRWEIVYTSDKMDETMMKEILLSELAKRDFEVLKVAVENVSFEDAFKNLGGFNLSVESSTLDDVCVVDTFFDYNFGCLNGTIYRTSDGLCELHERYDIYVNEIETTPIAQVDIDECGNVDVVKWYIE